MSQLSNYFYGRMVGSVIPVSWVAPKPLRADELSIADGRLTFEIVSHCWQYSHMLIYQLSSLYNHPPQSMDVTYTLFYCAEDTGTAALVRHFDQIDIPNVGWNWQPLAKEQLFRRAIGRNLAASSTTANWVWFSDCDTIFHEHCLETVATALQQMQEPLVFPCRERITMMLPLSDDLFSRDNTQIEPLDIDTEMFEHNDITKAKGAFQIVHGDVCRQLGYCRTIKRFQTPTERWRKTFEDTVFRKLIGSQGKPIDVEGLYRIRHIDKGRYAENSSLTTVRQQIRKTVD